MIGLFALGILGGAGLGLEPADLKSVVVPRAMFMCEDEDKRLSLLDLRHDKDGNFLTIDPVRGTKFSAPIAAASGNNDPKHFLLELRSSEPASGHTASVVLLVENEKLSATFKLKTDTESSGNCTRVPIPEPVQ